MSYSRVSLYDRRDGSFLTTIKTQTERSWVLSDYGTCRITLSLTDAKAIRRFLEFGTLVYVEHDTLPGWGGVLDVDEDWNDDGTISMNAYSGEYLLTFRRSPLNQLFSHGSAGTLFKRFIDESNKAEDLLIRQGSIWLGGTPAEDTMDGKSFYSHTKDLARKRGNDWSIDAVINSATFRMNFTANYYEKRGSARLLTLKEGLNLKKLHNPLKVQRKIVNDLLGIGEGSDEERPTWNEVDTTSRDRYGLRQDSEDLTKTEPASVQADTIALLRELRNPRRTFKLELLDVGDAFAETRLGDTYPLIMQTVGWRSDNEVGTNTIVRVLGLRYHDDTETMELTVDEVVS
jgi:hypothetical protein